MGQDKYVIQYDWRNPTGRMYVFCENWSTNSFIKFIFKFVYLSLRYGIMDVQYRNYKE